MGRFGMPELLLILVILMVLFGASKLPQLARSLGESIKEFKKSINSKDEPSSEQQPDDTK